MSSCGVKLFFGLYLGLFVQHSRVCAQFSFSSGAETGFYNYESSITENNDNYFISANGQLKYIYKKDNNTSFLQLDLNPQLYGINNPLFAFKLKANASYSQKFESHKWSIDLLKRNYFFSSDSYNSSFDIYYIQSMLDWKLTSEIPVQSIIGFAYQDIENSITQKSDLIFFSNKLFFYFNAYSQFNAGFYLERYVNSQVNSNKGFRTGPQFGFNYLKDFIFRAEYRLLFHISNLVTDLSTEHWIRLLAGKLLNSEWSAFLLVDYNLRNIHTEPNTSLSYSVIDSENHIYLKLAYEPTENLEFSFKSGYFNENYLINDASLEGWNFTFGFLFKN